MNDKLLISRRAFAGGALVLGLGRKAALAQGFAGLGISGQGFAPAIRPGGLAAYHGGVTTPPLRGKREQAREYLTTVTTMYREMGMTYWLDKVEAERSR